MVVRNGRVFDGRGGPGRAADVLVRGDRVEAIEPTGVLSPPPDAETIDAAGCWVTPGFVDLHTHYDAEVEVAPALFESLRHGVTTCVLGSCSLSMVLGRPADLADQFCRVEAIPRDVVLPLLERVKDWEGPREYFAHLDRLPLGPNVACLLGHSTLRSSVLGMERSLTRGLRPTEEEYRRMEALLDEALDEGFLGMSISTLPWDKLDGEVFRSRPMPSVFAPWSEYRRLSKRLRARGRVLQAVPNISTKLNVILFYLLSSGGLWGTPLKTTLISMMDVRSDRLAFRIAGALARFFNRFLRADFRLQALPEVFDLWADGMDIVVFEEFEAGAAALHFADLERRHALLRDPAYRRRFKRQWRRRWLPRAYHRNFEHSEVISCPDPRVVGKSFADIGRERGVDAVDAFLDLVLEHGRALRWYTVMGNDRPRWLEWIVRHPDILIGFSDAGAHLRNMAHYNFPLRLLRLVRDADAAGRPCMSVGRAVQRLTSEIAEWLGLDAGVLAPGRRADLVVVRPEALDERLDEVHEEAVPEFGGLRRLVRRNDEAVEAVVVGGRIAARRGVPADELGERPFGRLLRAGRGDRARRDAVPLPQAVA
ncbi:MAG: N-acyl-D-glutamate amidohydrolase [Planctomycetota bacterium]|nr:MAG: N-acyl-D-glutamate amidohydrolase [Planctomycetota bacterium]